ncbi:protein phosphatase 3, catalytic subunit [Strigomonas culicis]|nr:protein phosphatase 3, catalytic subunit [Strigomonas culicis]|eukprot:EPY35974.1 protein phosphatase 3, catalytic subunit [Strigomonas culicis]
MRGTQKQLCSVLGKSIIIGPIRGHACDFANYLLTNVLVDTSAVNIVLLGNYIDGAHQSIEVLYLVALLIIHSGKTVVPLLGKHELLYPIQPENFGSLRNELILRCNHSHKNIEDYEVVVRQFFASLNTACLVENRLFCVAGGPASGYRHLEDIDSETSQEALREFVLNEQMDEDEERIADGNAFVSQPSEQAFRFTFNAVCNFLSRNNLVMMIIGMEYHTSRPDYDSFARPNHYKESIYFPGFMFGRTHPDTKVPAVLTIFSAPAFCGVNRNGACLVTTSSDRIEVHELPVYSRRPLITPGTQDHSFSWAQPMMERAITSILRDMVFGNIVEKHEEDVEYKHMESVATSKMRRMCHLLKSYDLPLPELPK